MHSPTRIGIVGLGYIGQYHARGALNGASTELAAGFDTDPQKRQAFAEAFPGAAALESAEEMAARDDVDAVAIGVPNAFHAPLARLFLEAGKHVLVEKPMAMTVAEAEEMRELAAKLKRVLAVGHMWRFDPEAIYLRGVVERGELGDIVKTKGYGIHTKWGPAGWFASSELAGGGALADMGVHAIDTVRYLLGDPDPVSVYAHIGTYYGDYDVDDTGILVITWSNGTRSIIESGWWQPHMDGPEASTQLYGTRGYGRLFKTMHQGIEADARPVWPKFPRREEHCDQMIYTGQMEEFAAAIQEEREPFNGPDVGIAVMRICEAAYQSSLEDRIVRV